MIHLRIIRFIFVSLLFSFFLQITSAENSYSVEMNTFLEQDKDDVTDFESKDTQQVDVDNTEGVNGSANEKTVVKTKEPVVEVTTQKSILTLIQETDLLTKGIASYTLLVLIVLFWQSIYGVPEWLKNEKSAEPEPVEPEQFNAKTTDSNITEISTQELFNDKLAIELALQVWRLEKRISQLELADNPKLLGRINNSLTKFKAIIQSINTLVEDPINRKYVDGWTAVRGVSWESVPIEKCPDGIGEHPFVLDTVRPIIHRNGKVISTGQVVIGEYEGEAS